jgi:putative membrane protein (TIGR04086 family)
MRNISKAACVMKSLILAYVITGILLIGLAFCVYKMNLSESVVNLGIVFVYVFASFLGGFSMGKMMQEKKFLWGALTGLIYIAIIVIASMLAEGGVNLTGKEFVSAAILCLGGGTLGGMLS